MAELSKQSAASGDQPGVDAKVSLTNANNHAVEFTYGVQKMIFEEILLANLDMFDRARTQMYLLTEFVSKMASSHSVKDINSMYRGCSQHQIEFLRRDCDRLVRHHEWLVQMTSKLIGIYR
jgi:hypothetical protein